MSTSRKNLQKRKARRVRHSRWWHKNFEVVECFDGAGRFTHWQVERKATFKIL